MSAAYRLSLFYVGFFFAAGIQLPYWPVWLAAHGLGPGEIGAILAIGQWMGVAANPPLGMLADRIADRRRSMTLLAVIALAGYALCLPAHGFGALVLPCTLAAAASAALLPQADSTALQATARGWLDYGRVRLWGTLAFIAATLAGGQFLAVGGSDIVIGLMIGTALVVAGAAALMPDIKPVATTAAIGSWRNVLDRRFALFLTAAALLQSSHAVYYVFGTLYWQHLGYSDTVIAALWAEGAIAEVALFYGGERLLRRCAPATLMAVGGAGAVLRWSGTALATSLPALVALQPLHAMSFAAVHLGAMHFIARRIERGRAITAQAIYAAVVSGIGPGLASLAAGALYAAWSGRAYLAMAAMAGTGAILAAILTRTAAPCRK